MGRVPGIVLRFDATDVLMEGDRKIMKILITAAEQNCDSNRRFHIMHFRILICNVRNGGARWRSWLRYYATNRQVAGSIPDGVTGIFQ